ncbi:MAG TPA: hypothetical protein VH442_05460, partial [Micromonosporaceae bacterium]
MAGTQSHESSSSGSPSDAASARTSGVVEHGQPTVLDHVEPLAVHVRHVLDRHGIAAAELDEGRILEVGTEAETDDAGAVLRGAQSGPRNSGAPQCLRVTDGFCTFSGFYELLGTFVLASA